MKQVCLCLLMLIIALGIVIISIRIFTPEDTWVCSNGEWVAHGFPIKAKPATSCSTK